MMTTHDDPSQIATEALIVVGVKAGKLEQISARRGQAVYRVDAGDERYRLKLPIKTDDGFAPDSASVAREAKALESIPSYAQLFKPQTAEVSREDAPIACLLTRWVDGEPSFAKVTPDDVPHGPTLRMLIKRTALALEPLHARGWAHADIQPIHFMTMPDGGTFMLDLGLAQSDAFPMDDYRGGMVHFNAPEICQQVIDEGHAHATLASDVYAYGATLFFALTREFVAGYTNEIEYDDILATIASGTQSLSPLVSRLSDNTALAELLAQCLSPSPKDRPADITRVLVELETLDGD